MKISLYDFQLKAVDELLQSVNFAHAGLKLKAQIISFTAPTGAGKTVMMTAMMERILFGDSERIGDPDAMFVWVSDSPELNEQSRQKILSQSDRIKAGKLVIVDDSFDREQFASGTINFINTGKLGKDKLLTTKGEKRNWTFWNTLENTAKAHPDKLYVIIDEAHRGMRQTASSSKEAQSIVQKFILGSKDDELSKVPLVIGISATIERFDKLTKDCGSVKTPVEVSAAKVTESGLLKDTIILQIPEIGIGSVVENSLLKAAAANWLEKCGLWEEYCLEQGIELVKPVFVVQVQDGHGKKVTETDLLQCLQTIEEACGGVKFKDGEVVHTFNDAGTIDIGGYAVTQIDPSDIQENETAKVVFFKMNLSTGWDCPRAETMMSFRDAHDPTYIAQLLGRMIRTPLAHRVASGNDALNDVSLFLPYFDKNTSENVIKALKDELPDRIDITTGQTAIPRNQAYDEAFKVAAKIPSCVVISPSKERYRTLAVKLARYLTLDGIDRKASNELNALYSAAMEKRIAELKESGEMKKLQEKVLGVGLDRIVYDYGSGDVNISGTSESVDATPFDLWGNYNKAARILGENVAKKYWQKHAKSGSFDLRLEIIAFVSDIESMTLLESVGEQEFNRLQQTYFKDICALGDERKQQYYKLLGKTDDPTEISLTLPAYISYATRPGMKDYERHMYARVSDGKAAFALTTWEHDVVKEELEDGAYCWLRNLDRKPWALTIAYDRDGKTVPMYPDLVVFRKVGDNCLPSIIEPHDGSLTDNFPKAVGLAKYAKKHIGGFERIELVRQKTGPDGKPHYYRLDMCNLEVCNKVLKINSNIELDNIFEEYAKAKK